MHCGLQSMQIKLQLHLFYVNLDGAAVVGANLQQVGEIYPPTNEYCHHLTGYTGSNIVQSDQIYVFRSRRFMWAANSIIVATLTIINSLQCNQAGGNVSFAVFMRTCK